MESSNRINTWVCCLIPDIVGDLTVSPVLNPFSEAFQEANDLEYPGIRTFPRGFHMGRHWKQEKIDTLGYSQPGFWAEVHCRFCSRWSIALWCSRFHAGRRSHQCLQHCRDFTRREHPYTSRQKQCELVCNGYQDHQTNIDWSKMVKDGRRASWNVFSVIHWCLCPQ